MVKGARQVGKSYIIEEFGKKYYKSIITLNFFESELSSSEILKNISLRLPSAKLIENQTLLFLDEIQECPEARTALKFLAQDSRFDCIYQGILFE